MGEGILAILLQGGGSRHFAAGSGRTMMSVQGLGFPGSSSHLKGTEAKAWSGGVAIPDGWSGESGAVGRNGNLCVGRHGSTSTATWSSSPMYGMELFGGGEIGWFCFNI